MLWCKFSGLFKLKKDNSTSLKAKKRRMGALTVNKYNCKKIIHKIYGTIKVLKKSIK